MSRASLSEMARIKPAFTTATGVLVTQSISIRNLGVMEPATTLTALLIALCLSKPIKGARNQLQTSSLMTAARRRLSMLESLMARIVDARISVGRVEATESTTAVNYFAAPFISVGC